MLSFDDLPQWPPPEPLPLPSPPPVVRALPPADPRRYQAHSPMSPIELRGQVKGACIYRRSNVGATVRCHYSHLPMSMRGKAWYCNCGERILTREFPVLVESILQERMLRHMILATLPDDGRTIGITFQHPMLRRVLTRAKREKVITEDGEATRTIQVPVDVHREATHCRLYEMPANYNPKERKTGDPLPQLLSDGHVTRYHQDQHRLEVARKFALERAIQHFPTPLSKNDRRAIWEAYLYR